MSPKQLRYPCPGQKEHLSHWTTRRCQEVPASSLRGDRTFWCWSWNYNWYSHRNTEYPEMAGAPTRFIQSNSWPCTDTPTILPCASLGALFKCSWSSGSLKAVPIPWGACSVPDHPLGKNPFPDTQPNPPLTQLQQCPWLSCPWSEGAETRAAPLLPLGRSCSCRQGLLSVSSAPGWTNQVTSATPSSFTVS